MRAFLSLDDEELFAALPSSADTSSLEYLIGRAAVVYRDSITPGTRRSYASRWNKFVAWADEAGRSALPASSDTTILYLMHLVSGPEEMAVSTLRGRVAAIDRVHREAGMTPPGSDPALKTFLSGLVQTIGPAARRNPIKALRVQDLRVVSSGLPRHDPRLIRDAAIVALYASDVPPSTIAAMAVSDVKVSEHSVSISIPDPLQPAITRRRRFTEKDCFPVVATVKTWLSITTGDSRYLFTTTDALGQRSPVPISAADVTRTIERRAHGLVPHDSGNYAAVIERMRMGDAWALRDRALVLLGFAGAFRCASLSSLAWGDIREEPDGVVVHLRYSKTDREGRGRDVGIPYGSSINTCPVRALQAWRAMVVTQFGSDLIDRLPVFVGIAKSGCLTSRAMRPHTIATRVKLRARAAGLPGHWGGRSLRAGFISSAADLEIPLEEIARQSGHATLDSLIRYIRVNDPFHRNAASNVGL